MDREAFLDDLHARAVGTGVHYLSLAEHPFYQQRFGWQPEQWPVAQRIGRETASLPLSSLLTDAQAYIVMEQVRQVVACVGR